MRSGGVEEDGRKEGRGREVEKSNGHRAKKQSIETEKEKLLSHPQLLSHEHLEVRQHGGRVHLCWGGHDRVETFCGGGVGVGGA